MARMFLHPFDVSICYINFTTSQPLLDTHWHLVRSRYRSHFSPYTFRQTPHSSPVRARYGVSFVSANLTEVLSLNCCAVCTIISHITAIHRESIVPWEILIHWLQCTSDGCIVFRQFKSILQRIWASWLHLSIILTRPGRVTNLCISKPDHRCFRYWLVAWRLVK